MWWGTPATQYLVSHSVEVTGLTADHIPSRVSPSPRISRARNAAPAYSLHKGGDGSILLRLTGAAAASGVSDLRLIRADGAAAGTVTALGDGLYRLVPSRSRGGGPRFLQGRQGGRSFTAVLRRE
jgi:hypothetical protein